MTSVVNIRPRAQVSHSREWLFCLLLLCTALAACDSNVETASVNGATMGTTWSLKYVPGIAQPDAAQVRAGVQDVLRRIEDSMSTYRAESEISRYNAAADGEWVAVSEDFLAVLEAALQVGVDSGGAYDVTIAPLVDLWGFGPGKPVSEPPSDEAIAAAMAQLGQVRLQVDRERGAVLQPGGLRLDFSSLAKGYAIDEAAAWLLDEGVDRFLLEVGGEMRLSGLSARGDEWRVAIELPQVAIRGVASALQLTDLAVATSGDYRNYFEHYGKRYSHSIDPRTGQPVEHDLVSVTVVHDSAMLADAWATALLVLGTEGARAVAQAQGLAVYFISRVGEGFVQASTPGIAPYLPQVGQAGNKGEAQ